MATTSKVLFRGAASVTTTTTLYTVPDTSTTTVVTNIAVTNTTSTARTFTLTIDDIDIHTATPIDSNQTVYIDCKQVIPANATPKTIKGGASATSVNFHISGVEII
jgi:hypothetical protein